MGNGLRRKLDGRAEILDAVDRGFEVKDVLGSILNVVGGCVSAMLSGAIIATENHKAW